MASGISRTFSYFERKSKEVFNDELRSFINSSKCCMAFPTYLTNAQRFYVEALCAREGNLHFRVHQKDGIKFGKVYKETCNHYLGDEASVKFSPESRRALSEFIQGSPVTTVENFEMYPFFSNSACYAKDQIPIHCFSMGDRKTARIPENMVSSLLNDTSCNMHSIEQYRYEILSAIELNQVTIISGDAEYEKSIKIPELILKRVAENRESCRIVCAHTNKISALYESQFLASKYACPRGSTIGYQVNLDSVVSSSTCLLYTTTKFLLRCMLRGPLENAFQNITHLIFNNVHLRESHCDMILSEIRQATIRFPNLKIILLCSPGNHELYEQFFHNVKLVELGTISRSVSIFHLEEILDYMDRHADKDVSSDQQRFFDIWLQQYMGSDGSDQSFNEIFVLFSGKTLSVDMKHSNTKMTALMAATAKNKLNHVSSLITLNPDYFLCDINNRNALMWGIINHSEDCVRLLNFKMLTEPDENAKQNKLSEYLNARPNGAVDHALVCKVVKFIIDTKEKGVILIFLPTINDVIMQEITIKENIHIPVQVYLLHEYMAENDLEKLFEPNCNNGTIFLATDIAESAFTKLRARYVIDTGRRNKKLNALDGDTPEDSTTGISTDCMNRRTCFVDSNIPGLCIRLYTTTEANAFVPFRRYELPNTTIERIFVFAKLMSESRNIKEYFQRGMFYLPDQTIEYTLNFLKSIQVLDSQENITILGARLIDVHADFQLGKVILFAIALKCLDPVLSIVAALTYSNPFVLPSDDDTQNEVILTRKTLSEASNSDHLVLLRLFQKWQAQMNNDVQGNMEDRILSKIFEAISNIRAKIISALRSVKLIHSTGHLSMQALNEFSSNWAQVKMCFVAGMYPKIAKIEKDTSDIKSNCIENLELHPVSVLREMDVVEPMNNDRPEFIVFQDNIFGSDSGNLSCSSIITAITIALFGGRMKMIDDDLLLLSSTENSLHKERYLYPDCVRFHVDDWISFTMSPQDGKLILDLRKKFFHYFENILKHSNEPNYWNRQLISKNLALIKTISKILEFEEKAFKLPMPKNIGLRPRMQTAFYKTNQNRVQSEVAEFNIASIQNTNRHLESKEHDHYYVVEISNEVQIPHLTLGKFNLDYPPLNNILKESRKSNLPAVIYFLESNMGRFNAAAVFCPRSDPPLKQMYVACVPLSEMKELYPLFGLKFDENFANLEIPPQVGKVFLQYFKQTPRK